MSSKVRRVFGLVIILIIMILIWITIQSTGEKLPVDSYNAYFEDYNRKDETGTVDIMYFVDGGRNHWLSPSQISCFEDLKKIHEPYRFGYEFKGWYLDARFKYSLSDLPYFNPNWKFISLYAKWEPVIDNIYNVKTYPYQVSRRIKRNTIRLKDIDFSFIDELRIPGMPSTKNDEILNQFIFSQDQYPQGICLTEDYYLISAYSETEECMGEILVFDIETGNLLVTLGMDAESHLGGIAFDGENVWACNSAKKTIERISYDFIQLMANTNTGDVVDCRHVVDVFDVSNIPSCITFYGGRLWIATHTKLLDSKVVSYYYNNQKKSLKKLSSFRIPAQVQGLAFDETGKVYLSTSFGRTNSSYLRIYDSTITMSDKPDKPLLQIEMPPCSEEIHYGDGNIFLLFESAGEKYFAGTDGKGNSSSPLDKVLVINRDSLPIKH